MWTPWGYQVDADSLPPVVESEAFSAMTGGRYAGDLRVAGALAAASAAVRNACGWHVSPSLKCTAKVTAQGRLAKLPANLVTGVESVTDGGADLSAGEYEWSRDGVLRRACFRCFSGAYDGVEAAYTAGYDSDAVADLADCVRTIAEGVLSLPVGVASESAGGVSVSYSASAQSVAAAMADQMRGSLAPYRLVSAHAA